MRIAGIDPGPVNQSIVIWDTIQRRVIRVATIQRSDIASQRPCFLLSCNIIACEWIESFGMAVGKEIFQTVHAIGWMNAVCPNMRMIPRRDVKMHICHSVKARDANIRQSLIDRFGAVGTKKTPGPLFGVATHYWAALAVAVTAAEQECTANEWTWSAGGGRRLCNGLLSASIGVQFMLPKVYKQASLRVVTPSDGKQIGIGFDVDGHTERFCLSTDDATQLADLIRSHSEVCSGMPSLDVSSNLPVVE